MCEVIGVNNSQVCHILCNTDSHPRPHVTINLASASWLTLVCFEEVQKSPLSLHLLLRIESRYEFIAPVTLPDSQKVRGVIFRVIW